MCREPSSESSITSSLASRVRTFPMPESVPEFPPVVQDSTGKSCVAFAWYDPMGQCWRTWQRCLNAEEGWERFSETWPRSGIVLNGIAYLREPSVPRTFAIGYSWLPTPRASQGKIPKFRYRGNGFSEGNLEEYLACRSPDLIGKRMNPLYVGWMMGFPEHVRL